MAESRLATCTFCPLSPVGPSDWVHALEVQGEDAEAGGPEKGSLNPSEPRWGLGGLLASLPVPQVRCCHLGEIPNLFFFFLSDFLDGFVKSHHSHF